MSEDMQVDPMINVFNMIADRLSRLEENNDLLLDHLRFEHMCKPSGYLNSKLFGLPQSMHIFLDYELRDESKDEVGQTMRPFMGAIMADITCNNSCGANTKHVYALYHRYFPEKAAEIIKFEDENMERLGEGAKCADYNIIGRCKHVWYEVQYRARKEILERFKDRFTYFICQMGVENEIIWEDTGILVGSNSGATLRDHIFFALELFKVIGHSASCVTKLHITPCAGFAAKSLKDAHDWDQLDAEQKRSQAKNFVTKKRRRDACIEYFKGHCTLQGMEEHIDRMYQEVSLYIENT